MEAYTGESLSGVTHGDAALLYSQMLLYDENFKADVDGLIEDLGYRNSFGTIVSSIGALFGNDNSDKEALLYQAVLEQQKKSDTSKILIVSAFTAILIIAGVILVIKTRKKA